jgi:hypothetical protein
MNKDPYASELLEEGLAIAGHIGAGEHHVVEAAWWFASNFHSGQDSNLYRALTALDYRPGATRSGPEKGDLVEDIYDGLCQEFAGYSPSAVQRRENRARAAYACAAVRAYAKAKDEDAEECDIEDLIGDLLHLKALVYGDTTTREQDQEIERAASLGIDHATNERCGVAEYGQSTGLTMTDEQQCDLIDFIRDNGMYDLDKLEKPEGA